MPELTLRLVPASTTLPQALAEMAAARQCGLVVEQDAGFAVVALADVTRAINAAIQAGGDPAQLPLAHALPRTTPAPLSRNAPAGFAALAPDDPRAASTTHDTRYAVLQADAGHSRIVTASKGFAAALGGQFTLCKCAGPPPHVHTFAPGDLDVPGICNELHNAAVTCSDFGGWP